VIHDDSHVAKTGEIKDLIIVEEAGIAKGIRRVVAITGEDARQASQRANDAEAHLAQILKMTNDAEKDKALKVYEPVRTVFPLDRDCALTHLFRVQELNAMELSVVRKDALREKVKSERNILVVAARLAEKEQMKEVSPNQHRPRSKCLTVTSLARLETLSLPTSRPTRTPRSSSTRSTSEGTPRSSLRPSEAPRLSARQATSSVPPPTGPRSRTPTFCLPVSCRRPSRPRLGSERSLLSLVAR
jgi:hypothetical protein